MPRIFKLLIGLNLLVLLQPLHADKGKNLFIHREHFHPAQTPPQTPWLTGPLLTPSSQTVSPGYLNIEPYVYYNVITGFYNDDWKAVSTPKFYNVNLPILIYFGITEWMDILFVPQVNYNKTKRTSSLEFGDLDFAVDFQLMHESPDNHLPGLKFYIEPTFPTGSYQKLKPERLLTDAGGKGSYQTEVGIVLGRLFHFSDVYYMNLRLNLFCNYFAPVKVKGINAWGGSRNTSGRVYPGTQFAYFFGAEFTLSQNWVFAFDATGMYTTKTTFSGRPGTSPITGSPSIISRPSQVQFTFAPAIEYNFSDAVGIIAGSWFTVAGKSTPRFVSGAIAINYYGHVPYYHPRNPPPP
ncbi:MAG TPA: hypothetical protein VLF61_01865 [Rhabdochlamydiaceae bacterium]|nr:hypothetical protein [Rhabdochlamydiaceae bacterium]